MSAQTGMHGHSAACCTVPPVTVDGYKEKGSWSEIDGMKMYVTGPQDATKAILHVFDIFGYFPQTFQGADILGQQYRVFMPDWFEGSPADVSWYPPDTKEKGEKLGQFFQTTAAPPKTAARVSKVVAELQKANPNIKEWGVVGFCWGGKIVSLTTGEGTPFKAGAAVHPAMVDPKDAESITVPVIMLPSKDEKKEDVEAWDKNMKPKHTVKWYDDQVHGFMGARGDLKDENVKAKYTDGYQTLLNWFYENL